MSMSASVLMINVLELTLILSEYLGNPFMLILLTNNPNNSLIYVNISLYHYLNTNYLYLSIIDSKIYLLCLFFPIIHKMFSIQLLSEITQFLQKAQDNKLLQKKKCLELLLMNQLVFNILSVYKHHSINTLCTLQPSPCWYSTFNFYLHLYKWVATVMVSYI
jgi:hypothetical protein